MCFTSKKVWRGKFFSRFLLSRVFPIGNRFPMWLICTALKKWQLCDFLHEFFNFYQNNPIRVFPAIRRNAQQGFLYFLCDLNKSIKKDSKWIVSFSFLSQFFHLSIYRILHRFFHRACLRPPTQPIFLTVVVWTLRLYKGYTSLEIMDSWLTVAVPEGCGMPLPKTENFLKEKSTFFGKNSIETWGLYLVPP